MGVKGGGERVAIHSITATLKAGHEVSLVSEEFDQRSFEDFFGCNGLFDGIERLSYPAFSPTIKKADSSYTRGYSTISDGSGESYRQGTVLT